MIIETYDIVTLINCFVYTGYDEIENKYYQFTIHKDLNESNELYFHLKRGINAQIGFNNESFDYPIIHYFLLNYDKFDNLNGEQLSHILYCKAQDISSNKKNNVISDSNKFIQQIDLFLMWDYNKKSILNNSKETGVKVHIPNIKEIPIEYHNNVSFNQIKYILKYNINNVEETYKFLLTTLGMTNYFIDKHKIGCNLNSIENKKIIQKNKNTHQLGLF